MGPKNVQIEVGQHARDALAALVGEHLVACPREKRKRKRVCSKRRKNTYYTAKAPNPATQRPPPHPA
jgi:hypothetical protein